MLTLGPIQLEVWHLLLIGVGLMGLIWFLWGFLVPVTGTWERVDDDKRSDTVERITLVQFGPFIRGRRTVKGGFQEYGGYLRGRSITINRRDHGKPFIVSQGFPEHIADVIDGTVTARMKLTLSADNSVIHGTFSPQKIEFTHNPPEITARRFLEPSFRRYRLVSREPLENETDAPTGGEDEGSGKPTRKIRRTV